MLNSQSQSLKLQAWISAAVCMIASVITLGLSTSSPLEKFWYLLFLMAAWAWNLITFVRWSRSRMHSHQRALNSLKELHLKQKHEHEVQMQKEKLKLISVFSTGIAEELKTPLHEIRLAVESFHKPSHDIKEAAQQIGDNIQQCSEVIDALQDLTFSDQTETELIDLEIVAWQSLRYSQPSFQEFDIKVEKKFCENLGVVRGHSALLDRALIQILQNAVQSMPEGGSLTIGTERFPHLSRTPPGQFMIHEITPFNGEVSRIYIRDSGTGIKEESIHMSFYPFFSSKPAGAKNGLGLSMALSFLAKQNARVSLESSLGHGTTFYIDFQSVEKRSEEILEELKIWRLEPALRKPEIPELSSFSSKDNTPPFLQAQVRSMESETPFQTVKAEITNSGFQLRKPKG